MSIRTPYDCTIITLKEKLNETYIVYGVSGRQLYNSMLQADTLAIYNLVDPTKLSNYIVVKSNRQLNSNPDWDLVDALRKNVNIIDTLDMKTLDDSLKNKNRSELKKIVETTGAERKRIQDRIAELSLKQEKRGIHSRREN